MSAQPAPHTVDLDPPTPARPGLALALALLAIPGVTVAWDVAPGGGFTTGIPLAIAAVVIGLQARSRLEGEKGSRMALSAIVIAGLCIASVVFFMIAGSPDDADAQVPAAATTLTFKELERGSTFKHVRNTATRNQRSLSTGDLIVFTNPLADASGARIGRLYATCTGTLGNKSFLKAVMTCSVVATLRGGALMMQANVIAGEGTTTGAVVGGTGAYGGARGVLASKPGRGGSDDTVTLVG